MEKLKEKIKKYEAMLKRLATFDENAEDYYGGVSINYYTMAHDMMKLADQVLKENKEKDE